MQRTDKPREADDVHRITFKKSKRRGTWQLKGHNHTIYPLIWMRTLIESMLPLLGFDPDDREVVFLLEYSDEPFTGAQLTLSRDQEITAPPGARTDRSYGTYYRASSSVWGDLDLSGFLPSQITSAFSHPPDTVHIRISPTKHAIYVQ